MNTIEFDPNDWKGMRDLMKRHEEFAEPAIGKNGDGERVMISINADNITTITFQNNGWARENVYWIDGCTEELYHKAS